MADSEWGKLDEHIHGTAETPTTETPKAEWDKLDEHIHGKKVEENTHEARVTRYEDKVVISGKGWSQTLDFGEVKLNGVVLYDTRTWKTGDIISIIPEVK
jgi:hypothetical protein